MKSPKFPTFILTAFIFSSLAFIVMVVVLSWHNRISADDYDMITKTRELGIVGNVWDSYVHWIGRWSAITTASIFSYLSAGSGGLFFFTLSTFIYFAIAGCMVIEAFYDWVAQMGGSKPRVLVRMNIGIFLAHLMYFVTPDTRESFHWLCGSVCYGWGVSHALICFSLLARPTRSNFYRTAVASICALCAAGSNEVLGAYVVVVLVGATVTVFFMKMRERIKMFSITLSFALISFLFMALAPGNRIRKNGFNYHSTFMESLQRSFNLSWRFTLQFVGSKWAWMLGGAVLAMYLTLLATPKREKSFSACSITGALSTFLVFVLFSNWMLMFPSVFLNGELPPDRSWVSNSTMTFVSFWILGGWLGFRIKSNSPPLRFIGLAILSSLIFAIGGYRISHVQRMLPAVTHYARAFDERLETLRRYASENRTEFVQVASLPYQDIFSSVDWDIPGISATFQLPFKTILKK